MKYAIIFLIATTFALTACKSDNGQHIGQFKSYCETVKGKLALVEGTTNDYSCTLADGTVVLSR